MKALAWAWISVGAVGLSLGCAADSHPAAAPVASPASGPAARGQAVQLDPKPAAVAAEPARVAGSPGWLGVALTARAPDQPGVLISSVLRRSPAALGGLEVGDVVLGIGDTRVNDPGELSRRVAQLGSRQRVSLMVQRAGADRLLALELGENPGLEGQLRLGFVDAGAPELEHVQVARGAVGPTLEGLRGRVVVLEFWATWCGACRALLPTLNDWHARYQQAGGLVVSVTTDPVDKAARDAAELGLEYPVLSDPDGMTAQTYQAFALPTLFVIDRQGVVRDVSVGYDPLRIRELEATLARLLSET
jgi:peroxiredoxin